MTNGQTRVLVLLVVLLLLEAVVSKPVKQITSDLAHGKFDLSPLTQPTGNGKLPAPLVAYWAYGIGALALIALAGAAPEVATTFTLLLIVLVLVTHGTAYADALQGVVNTLGWAGVTAPGNNGNNQNTSTKK